MLAHFFLSLEVNIEMLKACRLIQFLSKTLNNYTQTNYD